MPAGNIQIRKDGLGTEDAAAFPASPHALTPANVPAPQTGIPTLFTFETGNSPSVRRRREESYNRFLEEHPLAPNAAAALEELRRDMEAYAETASFGALLIARCIPMFSPETVLRHPITGRTGAKRGATLRLLVGRKYEFLITESGLPKLTVSAEIYAADTLPAFAVSLDWQSEPFGFRPPYPFLYPGEDSPQYAYSDRPDSPVTRDALTHENVYAPYNAQPNAEAASFFADASDALNRRLTGKTWDRTTVNDIPAQYFGTPFANPPWETFAGRTIPASFPETLEQALNAVGFSVPDPWKIWENTDTDRPGRYGAGKALLFGPSEFVWNETQPGLSLEGWSGGWNAASFGARLSGFRPAGIAEGIEISLNPHQKIYASAWNGTASASAFASLYAGPAPRQKNTEAETDILIHIKYPPTWDTLTPEQRIAAAEAATIPLSILSAGGFGDPMNPNAPDTPVSRISFTDRFGQPNTILPTDGTFPIPLNSVTDLSVATPSTATLHILHPPAGYIGTVPRSQIRSLPWSAF